MDNDGYEHAIYDECTEGSHDSDEKAIYESQSTYNPYNIHMGQMTIYRYYMVALARQATILQSMSSEQFNTINISSYLQTIIM